MLKQRRTRLGREALLPGALEHAPHASKIWTTVAYQHRFVHTDNSWLRPAAPMKDLDIHQLAKMLLAQASSPDLGIDPVERIMCDGLFIVART